MAEDAKWQVETGFVDEWLLTLDDESYLLIVAALELLAEAGPQLGRPLVDRVSDSDFHNMKELRPGSSGKSKIRILFAFDPQRQAIVLVGGDKQGNWKKWYKQNIPIADELYKQHLNSTKGRTP